MLSFVKRPHSESVIVFKKNEMNIIGLYLILKSILNNSVEDRPALWWW